MINEDALLRLVAVTGTLRGDVDPRRAVVGIVAAMGLRGEAAEVGVFKGDFSEHLLANSELARLYCVDPYRSYDAFKDALNTVDLDEAMAIARARLERFGDRSQFLRLTSTEAAREIEDGSLDFVYLDGNHRFSFVTEDLELWWPKLKPGGLMVGDDCIDLDDSLRDADGDVSIVHSRDDRGQPWAYGHYGVFHALRAFSEANTLGYMLIGSQFIIPTP